MRFNLYSLTNMEYFTLEKASAKFFLGCFSWVNIHLIKSSLTKIYSFDKNTFDKINKINKDVACFPNYFKISDVYFAF